MLMLLPNHSVEVKNFSVPQIFREIDFGKKSRVLKRGYFFYLENLKFLNSHTVLIINFVVCTLVIIQVIQGHNIKWTRLINDRNT